MTELEPRRTGKNLRSGCVQKRARERQRNRLRARLPVQHRRGDGRNPRVIAAAGRRVCRCARFARSGLRARRVVVAARSRFAGRVAVLMTVRGGGVDVGIRRRTVRGTREHAGRQNPAGSDDDRDESSDSHALPFRARVQPAHGTDPRTQSADASEPLRPPIQRGNSRRPPGSIYPHGVHRKPAADPLVRVSQSSESLPLVSRPLLDDRRRERNVTR